MMVIAAVLRFPTAAVALGLGRRYDRGADSGLRASCPVVKRLTETLSHYVAADDGTLSRLELLAAVRDRIRDDLKAANRILAGQRPICGCGRPGRSLVSSWTVSSSRSQKVGSRKTAAPSRICIGEFRTSPALVVGSYQPILVRECAG
jgi:hypothetical protein